MSNCPFIGVASNDPAINTLNEQIRTLQRMLNDLQTQVNNLSTGGGGGTLVHVLGDATWLVSDDAAPTTTITHVGPGAAGSNAVLNQFKLDTGTITLSPNKLDSVGHVTAGTKFDWNLVVTGDTWLTRTLTASGTTGGTLGLTHATPGTHDASFDFTGLSSVAISNDANGNALIYAVKNRVFQVDGRGHKTTGNAAEATTATIRGVPTFPANGTGLWFLGVFNGGMAWVQAAVC